MTRSIWKNNYYDIGIQKKIEASLLDAKKTSLKLKSWCRSSSILKDWIGQKIEVYNGLKFTSVTIREEMVGHKLGEFSFTRKRADHKKKLQKKKK